MTSSTARLLPTFGTAGLNPSNNENKMMNLDDSASDNSMDIELTPDLESRLALLNNRLQLVNKPKLTIQKGSTRLADINAEFKVVAGINTDQTLTLTEKEKLAIEEYKLVMMKTMQNDLHKRYGKKKTDTAPDALTKPSKWRLGIFAFIILLELIPMTVGGFVGVSSILSTIPGFSTTLVYASSLAICAIESIMFYAVMGPLLKKALGINPNETAGSLLHTYEEKLHVTKDLNKMMTNEVEYTDKISLDRYKHYTEISKQFNNDVSNTKIVKFKEPIIKKVARLGLSVLNMALNISGGYFMATALLTMVSTALVGTPLGWGIIALVVLGGLVGRFAIRSNSMFDMINPKARKYREIEHKLDGFKNRNDKIDSVLAKKNNRLELIKENTQFKVMNLAPKPTPSKPKIYNVIDEEKKYAKKVDLEPVREVPIRRYSIG